MDIERFFWDDENLVPRVSSVIFPPVDTKKLAEDIVRLKLRQQQKDFREG